MCPFNCASGFSPEHGTSNPADRNGLTLLELIVSLGILAVLSTIAVTSLDPFIDQTRYESTRRLLTAMRDATLGDTSARQSNGQRLITGFLADTGRLPADVADFFTQPAGLIAHSVQAFDSNRDLVDDVFLSSGWRGPYFQLGPGQTGLVDGWGRTPLVDPDGGIFDFTSLGSDNDSVLPEDGYRMNLSVSVASVEYQTNVTFRLFAIDASTKLRVNPTVEGISRLGVLVYSVNGAGGTTGAIEEVMYTIGSAGTFEVSIPQMIQGPVAARGLRWSDSDSDSQLDSQETIELATYVHYLTVANGADLRCEMELQ